MNADRAQYVRSSSGLITIVVKLTSLAVNAIGYRNPLPDYYNITLEVYGDRTTRAFKDQCRVDEVHASHGNCPPGVNIGDSYIRRSVSESCSKTVS